MKKSYIVILATLASFSSLQAQTHSSTADDDEQDGCRWTYALEHNTLLPGSAYAEQVMQGAEIESQSGKCEIYECRWTYALEHNTLLPGSAYAEQVMRGAKIESRSGKCID